jgi:hypothetical protein
MTAAVVDGGKRIAERWAKLDAYREDERLRRPDLLIAELPRGSDIGLVERGAAIESTGGHPGRAAPLYAAALEADLLGERRRWQLVGGR